MEDETKARCPGYDSKNRTQQITQQACASVCQKQDVEQENTNRQGCAIAISIKKDACAVQFAKQSNQNTQTGFATASNASNQVQDGIGILSGNSNTSLESVKDLGKELGLDISEDGEISIDGTETKDENFGKSLKTAVFGQMSQSKNSAS